ncbi:MAG: coenzyme F420-0:L-glutamate ligase [Ectothiorhodospiraceae bacterium]|nr:coenzyme F420-0:L-glutamate ligase [Chromatiales bacterium]MCP5153306.1 coenzyme F420-0:L-glutamate ligase [Ectothiorhodospiraceae bacterium]
MKSLSLLAVPGIPRIRPGDDLASILGDALDAAGIVLAERDVLVVAQKIVSKAEGRYVTLAAVEPGARACAIARDVGKDPRLVEVILRESVGVVRQRPGLMIMAHRRGWVMANAGADRSNLDGHDDERVLLLPVDPDASAAALAAAFAARHGVEVAVIVADSVGRPFRNGIVGTALGAAGLPALRDQRGRPDLDGRLLEVTLTGFADQIASAASLLLGEANEGTPLVLVRGLEWTEPAVPASALVRERGGDLFR